MSYPARAEGLGKYDKRFLRFGLVLWHINHCRSFDAKSCLYINIKYIIWFCSFLWYINHCKLFNAKSIFIYKTNSFQTIQFSTSTHFIWPIDRTLSGATTPRQSGARSNGDEGVLRILQSSSITGTSPSDCYIQNTCWGRSLTLLQRSSRCFLHPQLTGPIEYIGIGLWHVTPCRLFNAKSLLYIWFVNTFCR